MNQNAARMTHVDIETSPTLPDGYPLVGDLAVEINGKPQALLELTVNPNRPDEGGTNRLTTTPVASSDVQRNG